MLITYSIRTVESINYSFMKIVVKQMQMCKKSEFNKGIIRTNVQFRFQREMLRKKIVFLLEKNMTKIHFPFKIQFLLNISVNTKSMAKFNRLIVRIIWILIVHFSFHSSILPYSWLLIQLAISLLSLFQACFFEEKNENEKR